MGIELSESQKEAVKKWVEEGCGLSEIQKRLMSEFGISATYMEVRFLIIDLGLKIKEKESKPAAAETNRRGVTSEQLEEEEYADEEPLPGGAGGRVTVQIDRVMKPGSILSGTVTFSDGVSASWMLDQMGRLALATGKQGYQPSPADLQDFQFELRRLLETRGFC